VSDATSEGRQAPSSADGWILVAIDFTKDSEAALLWASEYASCVGAKLLIVHVVHDPADAPGHYRNSNADQPRPMADIGAEMMDEFLTRMVEKHPEQGAIADADKVLVTDIPVTRILEAARTRNARSIVMGSRGRTGLPHLLLGSTAERVVQLSPIPVTIVKAQSNDG